MLFFYFILEFYVQHFFHFYMGQVLFSPFQFECACLRKCGAEDITRALIMKDTYCAELHASDGKGKKNIQSSLYFVDSFYQ